MTLYILILFISGILSMFLNKLDKNTKLGQSLKYKNTIVTTYQNLLGMVQGYGFYLILLKIAK